MGLFSTKKKVYVSSVIYNLAGAEEDRPDYLKTVVANHLLIKSKGKTSYAESFVDGYLHGPGINLQRFFRWCNSRYPQYMLTGNITQVKALGDVDLTGYLTLSDPDATIVVDRYVAERADFFYWAEDFIARNHPLLVGSNWTCDYEPSTNQITITFEDLSTESFLLSSFDYDGLYVYINYREEVRNTNGDLVSDTPYLWTYLIGSGTHPELDDLVASVETQTEFFPCIPLRKFNRSVRDVDYYTSTEGAPKAIEHGWTEADLTNIRKIYKKLVGRDKLDELLDSIEENESIDDIDHASITFGVCANDNRDAAKRYMYEFFRSLIPYQRIDQKEYLTWESSILAGWLTLLQDLNPEVSFVSLQGTGDYNNNYRFELSWVSIDETLHIGQGKPGASPGELWFEIDSDFTWSESGVLSIADAWISKIDLFWQTSETTYKKLRITGMKHHNYVYKNKAVITDLKEALLDGDESEFFLPIHYPTLRSMPLIQSTQLCTENCLIVFNCYKIVKVRWYQRGVFRVLLIIATVAVGAFLFPGTFATASGVLGANLAVGTALGYSATMAIIAGAVLNAVAGIVLMSIISAGATAIFGEKFGAIISAIAGLLVGGGLTGVFDAGSLSLNWGALLQPQNLLRLTEASASAYVGWVQGEIGDIQDKLESLEDEYHKKFDEIDDLYKTTLGYSGVFLNPLSFTDIADSSDPNGFMESSDSFLSRTLLTGDDLIEISQSMIYDFSSLSLELPKIGD